MKLFASSALIALAAVLLPASANATVTINVTEVGSDVVATGSGSLDLTGLTGVPGGFFLTQSIQGSDAYVGLGDASSDMIAYSGLTGPSQFGSGGNVFSSTSAGTSFAINGSLFGSPYVFVPNGYTSGTPIADTASWLGQSFASLGLTPGTYTWNSPSGAPDVIVNIGAPQGAVPEPATWLMLILGFGAVGFGMRRRRNQSAMALA